MKRDEGGGFVTSVYRKPTFTGMCLQWDAYCPVKYKVGLVRCLVNRAKRICSETTLANVEESRFATISYFHLALSSVAACSLCVQ